MTEKEVEAVLVKQVRRLGGRAYKWVSPGNSGVPDRIVILPGLRPVFVELKTAEGRLSQLQKNQIKRLEALGQEVKVLYGIQGVDAFLEGLERRFPDGVSSARLPKPLH